MIAKNAKRLVLAVGFALLLPATAGAAGFGSIDGSSWGALSLLSRAWEGLTSLWTGGGSIDPNGNGEGTNGGGSIDPNGLGTCVPGDCGGSIDPNG